MNELGSALVVAGAAAVSACSVITALVDLDSESGNDRGADAASPTDECTAPRPEWVFCDGFENGSKWAETPAAGVADIVASPGPFGAPGNHVMRLLSQPAQTPFRTRLPEGHGRLYARWFVMHDDASRFDPTSLRGGLHAGDPLLIGRSDRPDGSWFTAMVASDRDVRATLLAARYAGMNQDCPVPNGGCNPDLFPCLSGCSLPGLPQAGRWYCVELLLDAGAATASAAGAGGMLDYWIDGTQYGPIENVWIRSRAVTPTTLFMDVLPSPTPASVLVDHVVVSEARVGCR
jgi:hypothetical protein